MNIEIELKNMIEDSKWYLINYFDEIKTQIDIDYELKSSRQSDQNLRDSLIKEWIKLIDLVEKCQQKCINNKIPNELIRKARDKLSKLENNNQIIELSEIKSSIENYLLTNDSYLIIYLDDIQKDCFEEIKIISKLIITEHGLDPFHIEILKKQ